MARIEALDEAAAAELLTRGLPPMAEEVRRRLLASTGRLPLLLELVNARLARDVADGTPVDDAARQAIGRLERAGPAALDVTDADRGAAAMRAAIGYSIEALRPETRDRFFELGVFREDAPIPTDLVHLLWAATAGLEEEQARRTRGALARLSLVTLRPVDEAYQVVVLHDAVRAYLRSSDGLGDRRVEVNRRLVEQAGTVLGIGDGQWWRLPEGHFLWDHLAFHLAEAGRETELAELLADVRWLLGRLANGGASALEADLSLSQDARAVATRRLIARIGHLLGDLESRKLSDGSRLTHLAVLPHVRERLGVPEVAEEPALVAKWPFPETRDPSLIRTLGGHTGGVLGVAIAPDGTWLATASDDLTVRIWRPDGRQVATLTGHNHFVNAVAIAPDGTWLATASSDRTVRIWRPDGRLVATLTGHTMGVNAVAIAPDGTWLASASDDETVRIWRPDGRLVATLDDHYDFVLGVAIAPDGTWLATVSEDEIVRIWRSDGRLVAMLTGHTDRVSGVAIAPDGTWLASASKDGTVRIWRPDGRSVATLTEHAAWVRAVAIAPDGTWLATASDDRTIRIWRPDGEPVATLTDHAAWVHGLAIAPDGTLLAGAGGDGTLRIWRVGEPTVCVAAVRLEPALQDVAVTASGLVITCGGPNAYAFELARL